MTRTSHPLQFGEGYSVVPDHTEPRQSVYHVYHNGKLVETFYTCAEAVAFIEETLGVIWGPEGEAE